MTSVVSAAINNPESDVYSWLASIRIRPLKMLPAVKEWERTVNC